jgi:diacylglycerol kinase (ATP)
MAKIRLIYNPNAGRGRAAQHLPDILASLTSLGVETEVAQTRAAGDATRLARQAVEEGCPTVAVIGGDGSIREVVSGLVPLPPGRQPVTFGIIPMGTGNDFIKSLDVPRDWRAACTWLAEGRARNIDVGRVNGALFVNQLGIGFDAQVGIEADKIRWLQGPAVYAAALARNMLLSYRTPAVRVVYDGQEISQTITLLTFGNGRWSGGTFLMTPAAIVDDGLLDLCLIRGLSKFGILALVPKVMKGTHVTEPPVRMLRAAKVTVTSDDPLPVHADGDIIYTDAHSLEVEVLPGALRVIG